LRVKPAPTQNRKSGFDPQLPNFPMLTERLVTTAPNAARYAVDVLRHHGLVAFPTDTVYGLAAWPFKTEAVERLIAAKGHTPNHRAERAIAILLSQWADLPTVTRDLAPGALALARRFWPGPLTLVVPRHAALPNAFGAEEGIGVRWPAHPFAEALLRVSGPLAVTSANRLDDPPPLTAADVLSRLEGRIDLILDGGPAPGGVPSTVVDCTTTKPKLLREGPLAWQQIDTTQIP
jgi:L-threonylcarbamoyladenylate synthase